VIILDASVLANVVGDDGRAGMLARGRLRDAGDIAAPDLVDVETASVLRKRWLAGDLTARRFKTAIEDLLAVPIVRFPTGPLMMRAYELRANVTSYEAAYIALAEGIGCRLVTGDGRLARAPGLRCDVEVLEA
jgi:predicted nucleic acid-binding protein